jgi:hypothetical protein
MKRTTRAAAGMTACLILMAMIPTRVVRGQTVDYRVSLGYATGSYIFSGTTWSAAMFHAVDVHAGRLTFSASMPIVAQNSTALTYVAGIIVPTGGPDAAAVAQRRSGQPVEMGPGTGAGRGGQSGQGNGQMGSGGRIGGNVVPAARATTTAPGDTLTVSEPGGTSVNIGDPMFSGSAQVYSGIGIVRMVSLHLFAKAPVASVSSGLSTGKWDFGGGASLSLGADRTFFFGDASYWVLGDMPGLELLDIVAYGAGVGQASADGRWTVLASASGSSRVIANVQPPVSAGLSLGFRPGALQSFTVGVNFGLTESAAKVSTTLGWRARMF